ncbi:MAG: alanine racemase, partial [Candidatus Acidiferrum sp.]
LDFSENFMVRTKKGPVDFVGRPVWAEVSLSTLRQNFEAIRDYINPASEKRQTPRKVLSIVKGNGYGHGGPEVSKALEKFGSDWFGVASAGEGMELRQAGVRKPVLVLGGFWPGEEKNLIEHNLTPAIHRCEHLSLFEAAAAKAGKRHVTIHLKIDTGMNRLGLAPNEMDCFARQLAKCKRLELGGTFTHLASSEVLTDTPTGHQTDQQLERLRCAIDRLRTLGVSPGIVHIANSAAIAARPETWADMVRPGALLYGYHPGFDPMERRFEFERKLALRPVMSLRARIINVRSIAPGVSVGYNASWIAKRPSRVAVLAAGYGDGIHRSLGNRGSVAVRGHMAPIVGIVSMDVVMLDVTDVPDVSIGDVGTVYGTDGDKLYPANVVARSIGTVTSDLISGVGRRVTRFYLS